MTRFLPLIVPIAMLLALIPFVRAERRKARADEYLRRVIKYGVQHRLITRGDWK